MEEEELQVIKPRLTQYQKDILYNPARFTVTIASTKCGKTFSHIWWLYEKAHHPDVKEGEVFRWIAPTYKTAKIAFDRLRIKLINVDGYKSNLSAMTITCRNGAIIEFFTAENIDGIYGQDVQACVIDESSRCASGLWSAVMSTVTATGGEVKLIGNFTKEGNWVMKLAEKAKTDPKYAFYKITAYDAVEAGILTAEAVAEAKASLTDAEFKRDYLAEGSDDDSQLISEESLSKIFTNEIKGGVKYLTIDVARLGKDSTVAFVWDDLKIIDGLVIAKGNLVDQSKQLKGLIIKYNINLSNCIADENGVGGGLIDIMRIQGFINNATPIKVDGSQQNFASLKDQCLYKLTEMINSNLIGATVPEEIRSLLIEELREIKLPKELDTQRIRFISKDAIKKNIGRSPDYSDAVMMRMKFLLNPYYGKSFFY